MINYPFCLSICLKFGLNMCSVILEALRKSGEIKWVGKMSHLKVEVTKSNQSIIKVLFII